MRMALLLQVPVRDRRLPEIVICEAKNGEAILSGDVKDLPVHLLTENAS